jgi:hypothetical protein
VALEQTSDALERFRANLSDLTEARICLESVSQNVNLSELKLFQQIQNEKMFLLVDDSYLWIATSAVRNIDAATVMKSAMNLNLKSMVKNQAKLVKAGIEMARGSAPYQFKPISLVQVDSIIPGVETSTWKLDKHSFNLVFLDSNSTKIDEIPLNFSDMKTLEKVIETISIAIGRPQSKFGAFVGHLDSEGFLANVTRKGFSLMDGIQRESAISLDVWDNFIAAKLKNGKIEAHALSPDIKAELYVDGQLSVSYVSNRFGSASTGSVGLNLLGAAFSAPSHDKKKSDSRTINLQVIGSTWHVEMNLEPMHTNKARTLVGRINQGSQQVASSQSQPAPVTSVDDVATALTKLADMKLQGLLSDEEFEKAKSRLLS